jgi:hypothetical protein
MPKGPAKSALFGWRRGRDIRKMPDRTQREAREMRTESVAKSTQMLKGILDGKTYVAVAQESGLSRSAVEQRVKALARDRTRSIPARSAKILLLAQETAAVCQSSWTGLIHLLRSTGPPLASSGRNLLPLRFLILLVKNCAHFYSDVIHVSLAIGVL